MSYLTRIEILSFTQVPAPEFHTGGYRPFSLPEDLPRLFKAIERLDARLVIFDPFISLLSREQRYTNERLGHLLTDLNQRLIERNVACLLIRNCTAKGGHARPSVLERSDHFPTIATSHLLLSPDPMQPDRLLLSHAKSTHAALISTLILQIQPLPTNPDTPHITVQGSHTLQAKDFIESRPDTLHRRLLFQHLQAIITDATDPIPVATLYARSPYSSPFQIQRSLNDLLHMGQIERPSRGFYAPANPTLPLSKTATTTHNISLNSTAATTPDPQPVLSLNSTAAITPDPQPVHSLNSTAATTPDPQPVHSLNSTAATTPDPQSVHHPNGTAATAPDPQPVLSLDSTAAITPDPQPVLSPDDTAATASKPQPVNSPNSTAATTPSTSPASTLKPCGNWRHTWGCRCNT